MLEYYVILTLFLYTIYAYMLSFTLFVYLFNQNTEIYTAYRKSANKYRDMIFLLLSPSPTITHYSTVFME